MPKTFPFTLNSWLDHCRSVTHKDLDNVIVLGGNPGNGKSTLGLQLAKALDPTFSLDRCTFTVQDFINAGRASPPHSAILADELLVNRRKAMSKDSKDLLDFLQVCRGLNLHLLVCFPHVAMLDRAVLEHRVRYRIDIEMPNGEDGARVAQVSEKNLRTLRNAKGEEEYAVTWVPVTPPFTVHRNSGTFWEEYLAKKLTAARAREEEARGSTSSESERPEIAPSYRKRLPRNPSHRVPQLRVRETSPLFGILPERSPPESEQNRKGIAKD